MEINSLNQQKEVFDKESLLAMVSHDLKNPVNSGMLAIKLLQNPDLSPLNNFQQDILVNMMQTFQYMQNLIENVLDRYKFVNEAYTIHKMPSDFVTLVNFVIEASKYTLLDKEQKIVFLNEIKDAYAELDKLEIMRAVNNLISNSSIYSPRNSKIIIKLYDNTDCVGLSIENLGCSFKLDNPNEIFEKFVSKDVNSKSVASGLGLYIVKQIIEAHGGNVIVKAEINKFTRFELTIPRK